VKYVYQTSGVIEVIRECMAVGGKYLGEDEE
jgi:hypothetical protein